MLWVNHIKYRQSKCLFSGVFLLLFLVGCTKSYQTEVDSSQKISENSGNFNTQLNDNDQFGSAIANMGDLESDGVIDLAVGAPYDDSGGQDKGAIWILFMDNNGQVDIKQKIAEGTGGFTNTLEINDRFGSAIVQIGDLNNDGVTDLAVGAPGDDDGGTDRGAIWILFLNADGTVRLTQKISSTEGNFDGALDNNDQFGSAVTNAGDINGDGIIDLAVGVAFDDDGGVDRGAVWLLFMNADGTVNSYQKISLNDGNLNANLLDFDYFGSAVANLGDLDGNGINDLAVGAYGDDDGGIDRGAVWILFLESSGNVISEVKISDTEGKFDGVLADGDGFGNAIANLGDLNSDGINELGVGAYRSDDGGIDRGAMWVLFMRATGEVISESKISATQGNFTGLLSDVGQFGSALAGAGDLNGDGNLDIVSGVNLDDDGGTNNGAAWVLFMSSVKVSTESDSDRFESSENFIFTELYK